MNNPEIIEALRSIAAQRPDKLLLAEEVVNAASAQGSPLHNLFCWDDTEAARHYRIWQARHLIRTTVQFIKIDGENLPVRVFVSLTPDREEKGGGYRELVAVFSDKEAKKQLLSDALSELGAFQQRYARLKELAGVFREIHRVRNGNIKKAA